MTRGRRVAGILVVALSVVASACSGSDGEAAPAEADAAPAEGEAADEGYDTVEGRVGYLRLPPPFVGEAEFLDYSENEMGTSFHPIADAEELLLFYFGYLSCPDVCPTTLADVSQALEHMPSELAARVSVAMATVDLERDEGPEVATYMDVFVDRNHGLRSVDEASLQASADLFGALWEIEEHEPGATEYEVGHSAVLYVVDDRGQIIWEFSFGSEDEAMAAALEDLFAERYA
jgi:protein SCO1/2